MINTEITHNLHDAYANIHWEKLTKKAMFMHETPHTVVVNYPTKYHHEQLIQQIQKELKLSAENNLRVVTEIGRHKPQGMLQPLKKIKNIIAVCANKGGVGKSTIACNIAASIAQSGCRVGLLDGDLYGPNQPELLGIQKKAKIENNQYQPITTFGMHLMSMGVLVDEGTPLIWRGPMASSYFQQMVFNTNWPDLDYLILDCPPGTGDVLLTMTQKVPISGVLLVHTPQCLSMKDSIKGVQMLKKMQIPILGAIENMAGFTCNHCHQVSHIFPETMADQLRDLGIAQIGQIPLDKKLVDSCERGKPHVIDQPDDQLTSKINQMATRLCAQLACRPVATPNVSTHKKSA
jgi:ATP-binding protein involved in chromosome partitioning